MQTVPKGGGVGETKIVQGIWDHSIQLTEKRLNRKAVITDILQKVVKVAVGVLVNDGKKPTTRHGENGPCGGAHVEGRSGLE